MHRHAQIELTEPQVEAAKQRTRWLAVREGLFWSVMWGCGEAYVSPFAVFLKASNHALAFLGTVPPILGALSQMAGAAIVERTGRRRPLMVAGTLVQALSYVFLFGIPYLFPSAGVAGILTVSTVTVLLIGMAGPAWSSLMGDVVSEDKRGRYFARRSRYVILGMLLVMILAGGFLSLCRRHDHIWLGFGCLFLAAAAARLVSAALLNLHYDAPMQAAPEDKPSLLEFVRGIRESNFARFTLSVALMSGTTNVAGPFFSAYMLRDMHWTYAQFAASTAVFLIAQFFLVPWWGAICDRHGNRSVMLTTSMILPILPMLWAATRNFHALLGVQVLSGCAWSGFNLAASNFIYDAVPSPMRARAISYYSVTNGFFSLVGGSVIGAYLAEHLPSTYALGPWRVTFVSSLPGVFIVSGLLRILAGYFSLHTFKEVRATTYISPFRLLWRLTLGEPIIGTFGDVVDRLGAPLRRLKGGSERADD